MNREKEQRDILFNACKQIATNKRCPDWIAGILRNAVINANAVPEEFPNIEENTNIEKRPIMKNDTVYTNVIDNTHYTLSVIKEQEAIEGIRLFTLLVKEGNGPHKVGSIIYNVPETWLSLNRS